MNMPSFVFSLFIAATIPLTLALRAWRRGGQRALSLSLLLVSLSVGTFGYALELLGLEVAGKFFWLVIKYVGIVFAPVFWLIFAWQFTEKRQYLRWQFYLLLALIPSLTIVLLAIPRTQELMFRNIHIQDHGTLTFEYGPYFWLHAVYTYFLFLLGGALMIRWLRQNHILRLLQALALIAGALIPITANLMTILDLPIGIPYDLTTIGLTLGVLIIGWALFGLNFSGVNPIARESLIESLKDGVIVVDTQRMITDINPAVLRLVSTSGSPLGQPLKSLISEPVFLPTLDMTETYPHQEITLQDINGVTRDIDLRASPLTDRSRILRGWLLLLRDITEQKRLQTELKKQNRRNAALAEIELDINQRHDLSGVLKKIVEATVALLPAPGGATIMMWSEETRAFEHAESTLPPEETAKLLRRAKQGKGSAPWIVNHQQPKVVTDTRAEPFGDHEILAGRGILAYVGLPLVSNSKIVGVLYANDNEPHSYAGDDLQFLQTLANRAANAIFRVQQFSQVQQQAITDHVTGIHNRRQLFNLGELEFRRARRFDRPLSAIMIDIDHFKNVNDTHGHAKGDQVLKSLAQFLQVQLREFDILGRYGGEEFVIVLPGADLPNARNVAYRLRTGVQERPMINGSVSITVSLGVTELSSDILDFQALMNKADMAMYDAKRAGRNRVAWAE